jgi:AraC family transcriptional regulator
MDARQSGLTTETRGLVPSFADFLLTGPYAGQMIDSRPLGAGATLFRYSQPAGHFPDPAAPDFVIQMPTKGNSPSSNDMGAGRWTSVSSPGSFIVNIPGEPADYVLEKPQAGVVLSVPGPLARRLAGGDYAEGRPLTFGRLHERFNRDPLVEALLLRLAALPAGAAPSLLVESATATIIAALLHAAEARPVAPRGGMLSAARFKRVIDFVEAHLDRDIALNDLAEVCCLSPYHFARAFKARMGSTPYGYVLERRMERAKLLMLAGDLSLCQVALECGFASQSHFTTAFKRVTGITPGEFRKFGMS